MDGAALLATATANWLLYKLEKPNVYPRGMFNAYTTVDKGVCIFDIDVLCVVFMKFVIIY